MQKIRKAVIPAAGLGTRFYPLTRAQPKEMLPLVDKPIIHYVVDEAIRSGLEEILIIVGAGKDAIINYFDSNNLDSTIGNELFASLPEIYFVRQRQLLGLADSLRYARKFVDGGPFAVLLGDTVYRSRSQRTVTKQMIDLYERYEKPVLALEKVPIERVTHYGIVSGKFKKGGYYDIKWLVEKPTPETTPSNLGVTGLYALNSDIFDFIEKIKPGKNNELQLTDALALQAKRDGLIGFEINGKRYDMGDMNLWIEAFIEFVRSDERFAKCLR